MVRYKGKDLPHVPLGPHVERPEPELMRRLRAGIPWQGEDSIGTDDFGPAKPDLKLYHRILSNVSTDSLGPQDLDTANEQTINMSEWMWRHPGVPPPVYCHAPHPKEYVAARSSKIARAIWYNTEYPKRWRRRFTRPWTMFQKSTDPEHIDFLQTRLICMEREVLWKGKYLMIPRLVTEDEGKYRRPSQDEKYAFVEYLERVVAGKETRKKKLQTPTGVVHLLF